jgi:hypothetical protein
MSHLPERQALILPPAGPSYNPAISKINPVARYARQRRISRVAHFLISKKIKSEFADADRASGSVYSPGIPVPESHQQ